MNIQNEVKLEIMKQICLSILRIFFHAFADYFYRCTVVCVIIVFYYFACSVALAAVSSFVYLSEFIILMGAGKNMFTISTC